MPPIHGTLRPVPAPPSGAAARPRPPGLPKWGWLEWFVVSQTFIPALVFLPGVSVVRMLTRVAAFVIALVAWAAIIRSGRRAPGKPFQSAAWLKGCAVWLGVMVFHPDTNSPLAGFAHAAMYLTVFSPVFWAPAALISSRQVSRLMVILFLCNIPGTFLGIAQVSRPNLNPAHIPALEGSSLGAALSREALVFVTDDGRKVLRPCGLTDIPGGACFAGAVSSLIGLCLALQPIALWQRLASFCVALAGITVIYYCQIRTAMVVEFLCIIGLIGIFILRGDVRRAMLLGAASAVILVGATAWAMRTVGTKGIERFGTLLTDKPAELYHKSRGSFVEETFQTFIWQVPLGGGLGRWGRAYDFFGDHSAKFGSRNGPVWIEVQWPAWVMDGGVPLLVAYVMAIALAVLESIRIALWSRDRELAYWAAIICAMNLSVVATCFSQYPFLAPAGIQFWLLAAVLHAADQRSRLALAARGAGPPWRRPAGPGVRPRPA